MVTQEKVPLIAGNSKLGKSIWQFSLPAIETCPGRSELCEAACYACQHHYLRKNVRERLEYNDAQRLLPTFVKRVSATLWLNMITHVRIHPSGDFDTPEYVEKWMEIAEKNPKTVFFAYTRSWRSPELLPLLRDFSRQANVHLWWSCDRETGAPPRVRGIRRAFMMCDDNDKPRFRTDLVFRVKRSKKLVTVEDTLVCPAERIRPSKDGKKVTCAQCRLCFERASWLDSFNDQRRQPQVTQIGSAK